MINNCMGIPTNKKLIAKEIFELNPSWIIELLIKRNDKKTENPGNKWYKKDKLILCWGNNSLFSTK